MKDVIIIAVIVAVLGLAAWYVILIGSATS